MTTIQLNRQRRKLDLASLALALIGLVSGVLAYVLIETKGYNALVIVPAVVTLTIGLLNITKLEAPRD